MSWEVVMIWFSCVCANHLGLISAIESIIGQTLPIVNCSKCFTFWCLIAYGIYTNENVFITTSISFAFAYAATWLELLMGYIDYLFSKCYDKIYPTEDNEASSNGYKSDTSCPLS